MASRNHAVQFPPTPRHDHHENEIPQFMTPLETFKHLLEQGSPGNRWYKVNLHVHGKGHDAAKIIDMARAAEIDLLAITDHQSFRFYDAISRAAGGGGRPITVLPGIEITAREGVHLLAVFPLTFSQDRRTAFCGWLEIDGQGDTGTASRKGVSEVLEKVDEEGGVVIVPHPFSNGIGLLDSSRKTSTKLEWLESGRIHLFQVTPTTKDKVKYVEHDNNDNWLNRYVLSSADQKQIAESTYCLAPFSRTDVHLPEEIGIGCSWFRMQELGVKGLKQVACEPRTRISAERPSSPNQTRLIGLHVLNGYCAGQLFSFNDGLNCLVGQNYSGKSTVLDLIRFALGHDLLARSRGRLLERLNATLRPEGIVRLYVQKDGQPYFIERTFKLNPSAVGRREIPACPTTPAVYRFDEERIELLPVGEFDFPVEVYEQGHIHDLRDDLDRQLDMLDEFAGIEALKRKRGELAAFLNRSADGLAPLHKERERLRTELAGLPTLRIELVDKTALLPGEEHNKWAAASIFSASIEAVGMVPLR